MESGVKERRDGSTGEKRRKTIVSGRRKEGMEGGMRRVKINEDTTEKKYRNE